MAVATATALLEPFLLLDEQRRPGRGTVTYSAVAAPPADRLLRR